MSFGDHRALWIKHNRLFIGIIELLNSESFKGLKFGLEIQWANYSGFETHLGSSKRVEFCLLEGVGFLYFNGA